MAPLFRRERDVPQQPADLGWVVVLDRGLEMLSRGRRLLQLATEPAQQADLGGARHAGRRTTSVSPSSSTEPPSARTRRTATAAPRSRSSSPSSTGPDDQTDTRAQLDATGDRGSRSQCDEGIERVPVLAWQVSAAWPGRLAFDRHVGVLG